MMSKKPELDVDSIIEQLLAVKGTPGKQVQLPETQIRQLCQISRSIFLEQPMLVELEAPVNICGDIHGQYEDLLRHFDKCGYPPSANYLFLGDYVDRGKRSLETICLVLAYKIKYPNNFFLIRGNHESASINRIYGFYDECKRRYNIKLWKTFTDCFNCLPIAALVEGTIFCMHGGLSPDLTDLDQVFRFKAGHDHIIGGGKLSELKKEFNTLPEIRTHGSQRHQASGFRVDTRDHTTIRAAKKMLREIDRPMDVPDHGMVCDILWSDPDEDITGWGENDRGVSFTFGGDVVKQFLKRFDCSLIVRAHQVVEDGYQFFQKRKLVTIFSAPNYCGEFDNAAAVMIVSEDLTCSFRILPPEKGRMIAVDSKSSKK